MSEVQKNKVILQYLETVSNAVMRAQEVDESERAVHLRGVLYYWLGIMFDEGRVSSANLEIANDALLSMLEKFKRENKALLQRISDQR